MKLFILCGIGVIWAGCLAFRFFPWWSVGIALSVAFIIAALITMVATKTDWRSHG